AHRRARAATRGDTRAHLDQRAPRVDAVGPLFDDVFALHAVGRQPGRDEVMLDEREPAVIRMLGVLAALVEHGRRNLLELAFVAVEGEAGKALGAKRSRKGASGELGLAVV